MRHSLLTHQIHSCNSKLYLFTNTPLHANSKTFKPIISSRRSFLRLHTSADTSSATSRNETDLLSGARATAASRRLTNVLVVTSSVGVIHRVHAHTAHLRPLIALHSELVVRTTRLQHRLVHAASAGHDSHHATAATRYNKPKREEKTYLDETVFLMPEGRRMNVMLRSSE